MNRLTRIKVFGKFTRARPEQATVIIDRKNDLISVRPYRSWRLYTLPLSKVAEFIVWTVVKAEVAEKKTAQGKK